jgi:citrate synthase
VSIGFKAGLEDVIAAASAICTVDGAAGQLRYRGYDINNLVGQTSFEEVTHLLWSGDLPNAQTLGRVTRDLAAVRTPPAPVMEAMQRFPTNVHPLEALRTVVSLHAMYDPDAHDNSPEANRRKSMRLVAQMATLVAAWRRIREGRPVVPPDPEASHAANFLWMLSGTRPDAERIAAMEAVLVLHAEHELNASTFAARVAIATVSDLHSAVTSAIGTLKGPRHGGANEDVLAMLQEIGTPDRAAPYLRARLEALGRMSRVERAEPRHRIPGFGHRVYKVDDPRAAHLRALGRRLAAGAGVLDIAETAEATYRVMHAETRLPVNVDFFSAVIYHALGIPIDLCTSIFAVSRIPGWCAHIMEQFADNRLIRPRADYIGPAPRTFVPLAARP